jgi:choline kinase
MRGIILAAGKGKRLGKDIPKCLQEIGEKTILKRQLDALAAQGLKKLVCVIGYQKEVVAEAIKKIWPHDVVLVENPRYNETNTSYSLYLASEYMDEDFFYMNADVVFRSDLLDRLVKTDGDASLGIQHKQCGVEEVKVIVDGSHVVEIGKDLDPSSCLGEFVGVALFRQSMSETFIKALAEMMDEGHYQDYFEGALKRIARDTNMTAVDITDIPCIEIDFPEDLKCAQMNAKSYEI